METVNKPWQKFQKYIYGNLREKDPVKQTENYLWCLLKQETSLLHSTNL